MPTATTGFSHEAALLDSSEYDIRQSNLRTVTQSRQVDFEDLWDAWKLCSSPNWDGDGAREVEQDCYRVAYRFIEEIPTSLPSPTISGEPDGHINLEWYSASRRTVSVSISPDGTVYWASLIGTERMRAAFHFTGELPKTLLSSIARVNAG